MWTPSYMSVVVFAGASQFLFTGVVAAGGSPVAAVLAGLLVNARHLPFGFALADTVKDRRLLGSYLMIDEVVAFALAQRDPRRRRVAFFTCGIMLWVCWNIGALLGALAGTAITDTDAFGLDAAFPAVLVALILPGLRNRTTRAPALLGAAIALALTPFLPSGLPVLFSLFGLVARPTGAPARGGDRMIGTTAILVSGVVLGAGTFAYRAAGPLMRSQFTPSLRIQALMGIAATVLLVALAATSAVADGREPADLARPSAYSWPGCWPGVGAPFVVVVLAAAGTAAGLRLLGL